MVILTVETVLKALDGVTLHQLQWRSDLDSNWSFMNCSDLYDGTSCRQITTPLLFCRSTQG